LNKENPFIVLLDSIQDPGNMGTIIRTADAAGFDGVIALNGCVDIYNPKVLRATMGSIFHIAIADHADMAETMSMIRKNGLKTFAAHLRGDKSIYEADMCAGGVILIGNEANGLSDELTLCADELVKIPMPGKAESLNASIASALFMYEMVRQGN
jgi:TrmH family RNA methyltransferase